VWKQKGATTEPPQEPDKPDKGPAPPYLQMYWRLQRWHCMLRAGGFMDQPDWVMDLIELAGTVWENELADSN
jgi:hypothetical protein